MAGLAGDTESLGVPLQRWSGPEKLLALDELIDRCEPAQIKYMMQVIEPQFQRDFISLLPKEVSEAGGLGAWPGLTPLVTPLFPLSSPQLALYVLSFLEPRDLLRAAQTCRYWRVLAEDNLLWREKCREEGEGPLEWGLGGHPRLDPGEAQLCWPLQGSRSPYTCGNDACSARDSCTAPGNSPSCASTAST